MPAHTPTEPPRIKLKNKPITRPCDEWGFSPLNTIVYFFRPYLWRYAYLLCIIFRKGKGFKGKRNDLLWRNYLLGYVMKWDLFPHYLRCARENHRPPVDSIHIGPVMWDLVLCLMIAWTKRWTNSRGAGDLRFQDGDCGVTLTHRALLVLPSLNVGC